MTRRSAPKARRMHADTWTESKELDGNPRLSSPKTMKTPKRKRAAANAVAAEAELTAAPIISLPANCTLRETQELKAACLRWIDSAETVKVDVSALQRIDTAAIQVLCAFVRERSGRGLPVCVEGSASALAEAARLLGAETALGLPVQAA